MRQDEYRKVLSITKWVCDRAEATHWFPLPIDGVSVEPPEDYTFHVEWGDELLDVLLPPLPVGKLVGVFQEDSEFKDILYRMISRELSVGRIVYWLDGGGSFDKEKLSPHLRRYDCELPVTLSRLRTSRGLTPRQISATIDRLRHSFTSLNNNSSCRLVVCDKLPHQYVASDVSMDECRSMMLHTLIQLKVLAERFGFLVLIPWRSNHQRRLPLHLSEAMNRSFDFTILTRRIKSSVSYGICLEVVEWMRSVSWALRPEGQMTFLPSNIGEVTEIGVG